MRYKPIRTLITGLLLVLVALPLGIWAGGRAGPLGEMFAPSGEIGITESGFSTVGGFSSVSGGPELAPSGGAPALLTQGDYQAVYDHAQAALDVGVTFRTQELYLAPSGDEYGSPIEDPAQNYADFNAGELYRRFCIDYQDIDPEGFCRETAPEEIFWDLEGEPPKSRDIRNKLLRARELMGFLSLADPANIQIQVDGQPANVRQAGREGVLAATREIANIHMVFGNEFVADALDYRFQSAGAEQIINEEIALLELAREQFELAVDVLAHAFNADLGGPAGGYIGDYFTDREFELFGIVSERAVVTLGEIALRYRQLGQDQEARELYAQGYTAQYAQAVALAEQAAQRDADFLDNGGWELVSNLERLAAEAQAIQDGVNPYGFVSTYVPLQTYGELSALTEDFLGDATEDEIAARDAVREFDRNRTALESELLDLRVRYEGQLLELCGASSDDYQTCDGGLMEQNFINMQKAFIAIQLADQRIDSAIQQIQIEQERADAVIQIILEGGEALALIDYAIGLEQAYRVTESVVESQSSTWSFSLGGSLLDIGTCIFGVATLSPHAASCAGLAGGSYTHSDSTTTSMTQVWDPEQEELGRLQGLKDVQQAATQAAIEQANSEAAIRNLLLRQAELMIERDIAIQEYNRVAAEHNHLVERYHNLLNLRANAQANVLDSYLNNPAFRILRDHYTTEAIRSHELAAQFAYLTAKALEYDFLTPYPDLADVFEARSADDVDNFVNNLEQWRVALGSPGERNRYPYRISLAQDLLGLSDENLDPDGSLSPSELAQLRFEEFQAFLARNVVTDTVTEQVIAVELDFTTSLLDDRIFSPNIWNNRIAGVGLPAGVPGTQGLSINLLTRQFGDIGTPEIQLTHGGHASYRTVNDEIVEYVPENAKLVGFSVPPGFESKTKTALILADVNGNGQGTPTSALFNRSVAASSWTLRVDLTSPFNDGLDVTQLEDVEILMDTTGIALPARRVVAAVDAQRLQAVFLDEPMRAEPGREADLPSSPARWSRLAPARAQQTAAALSGRYAGSVDIDAPESIGALDLAFTITETNGSLSGRVDGLRTLVYDGGPALEGSITSSPDAPTPTFQLESAVFSGVVSQRMVQRRFTLVGEMWEDGDVLYGQYEETIEGLTPDPLLVRGAFLAMRGNPVNLGDIGPVPEPGPALDHFVYLPVVLR